VAFLFAPHLHPGIARVMPVRRALGTRTIFNALGPLVNPARPAYQLIGVYDPRLCTPLAETLGLLGCRAALVVHGAGLDEIALHGPTVAARLADGRVEARRFEPADFGLSAVPVEALAGGTAAENARSMREALAGRGPAAHIAAIAANAGALLWIAGRAADPAEGTRRALEALGAGAPLARLEAFLEAGRDA
jgi:anthranilate phosphoribosyltransferase